MAEEPNALLSKLTDQFDLDKVKTIAPDEGHPDNDWLVIFWQDLHFGVVNIDSTYDGENVELKSGQPLSFGDKMHALYGPELLKAIFITRGKYIFFKSFIINTESRLSVLSSNFGAPVPPEHILYFYLSLFGIDKTRRVSNYRIVT